MQATSSFYLNPVSISLPTPNKLEQKRLSLSQDCLIVASSYLTVKNIYHNQFVSKAFYQLSQSERFWRYYANSRWQWEKSDCPVRRRDWSWQKNCLYRESHESFTFLSFGKTISLPKSFKPFPLMRVFNNKIVVVDQQPSQAKIYLTDIKKGNLETTCEVNSSLIFIEHYLNKLILVYKEHVEIRDFPLLSILNKISLPSVKTTDLHETSLWMTTQEGGVYRWSLTTEQPMLQEHVNIKTLPCYDSSETLLGSRLSYPHVYFLTDKALYSYDINSNQMKKATFSPEVPFPSSLYSCSIKIMHNYICINKAHLVYIFDKNTQEIICRSFPLKNQTIQMEFFKNEQDQKILILSHRDHIDLYNLETKETSFLDYKSKKFFKPLINFSHLMGNHLVIGYHKSDFIKLKIWNLQTNRYTDSLSIPGYKIYQCDFNLNYWVASLWKKILICKIERESYNILNPHHVLSSLTSLHLKNAHALKQWIKEEFNI